MTYAGGSYSWNAICKVCGFQYKGQDMRRRWDGLEPVCQTCWEPRHPLDFYRTRSDFHKLPWQTPAEDIIPETGLSFGYEGSPAWAGYSLANSHYWNYWWTTLDCRPVALRYYHDGLYTQANSPISLSLWTRRDFESNFVQRAVKEIPLLPNNAGWVEVPLTQAETNGIQFVNGDAVTYVLVGLRFLGSMTQFPISLGGTVTDQPYLNFQQTLYSGANDPDNASPLTTGEGGGSPVVIPVDVVVKPESAFAAVVYT